MTKNVTPKNWAGSLYSWSDGSERSYPQTPSPTGLAFPRTAVMGFSGDANSNQLYPALPYSGQVSGKVISTSGFFAESSYSDPVAWLGRGDIAFINGNYEGWDSNGAYDRGLLVDAIQQILNVSGFTPTSVYQYHVYESRETNNGNAPYNQMYPTFDNEKWGLYGAANQSGSPVTSFYGNGYATNWAVAWPGTVNGVAADQQISPGRTTAVYDGNKEDMMQYAAAYFIEETFARHGSFTGTVCGPIAASAYTDSRWTFDSQMKAPNLAGVLLDNLFCIPQTAGYYDLANNYSAYNWNSPTMPWLLRGAQHFGSRFAAILAKCYTSRNYNFIGNIAQFPQAYWLNKSNWSTLTDGLTGLQGGFVESLVGPSYAFGNSYGTAAAVAGYQATMDLCVAPKHVIVNCYPSNNTDYQTARYTLALSLMDDGYFLATVNGSYKVSDTMWLDELGGNPGTNIGKGWLGQRIGSRPTAAAIGNCWVADFEHGTVVMLEAISPSGGSQTVTASQINTYLGTNYSFKFFQGVQNSTLNSGAAMSSVTLTATSTIGDAVLLTH